MKTKNKNNKTQENKYRNILHSLSNDIININCSINTIERTLNDKGIDINNVYLKYISSEDYCLANSIKECKNSMLNMFYKLDEYTKRNKLTY